MRIGVYPGSFDPFTNGHLDIVNRALKLVDKLVIAIAVNSAKRNSGLFTMEERKELIGESLKDEPRAEVTFFEGLTVDFCSEIKASVIIRGIRAVTDFDNEYAIYQVNKELEDEVETIFLLAGKKYSFLSSTIIKEIAQYGRTSPEYAPQNVNKALLHKFNGS